MLVGLSAFELADDETVILLHASLPLAGVSIVMERERQQNDSLVNGYLGASGRVEASRSRAGRHKTGVMHLVVLEQ